MSTSTITKTFADRLQDLIAESGKSISVLANEIGIASGSLSKYQNDGGEPGINALAKIAKYFDVSTDWLLGLSEVKSTDTDIKAVCKYTNLSEEAVGFLVHISRNFNNSGLSLILSMLLSNNRFFEILSCISESCSFHLSSDKSGDIFAIDKFDKMHRKELKDMGGAAWSAQAISNLLLDRAGNIFIDCAETVRNAIVSKK